MSWNFVSISLWLVVVIDYIIIYDRKNTHENLCNEQNYSLKSCKLHKTHLAKKLYYTLCPFLFLETEVSFSPWKSDHFLYIFQYLFQISEYGDILINTSLRYCPWKKVLCVIQLYESKINAINLRIFKWMQRFYTNFIELLLCTFIHSLYICMTYLTSIAHKIYGIQIMLI